MKDIIVVPAIYICFGFIYQYTNVVEITKALCLLGSLSVAT